MKTSRVNIVCSEKDKKEILNAFENSCPFMPFTKECGEDARCDECVERYVNFDIVEDELDNVPYDEDAPAKEAREHFKRMD